MLERWRAAIMGKRLEFEFEALIPPGLTEGTRGEGPAPVLLYWNWGGCKWYVTAAMDGAKLLRNDGAGTLLTYCG